MRTSQVRELGIFSEVAQVLIGLQECLLDGVFRIFPVVNYVLGDSEQFAIVAFYELLEGRNIPILAGMDKIEVIASHRPDRELYRVRIHIRYVALKRDLFVEAIDAARNRKAGSVAIRSGSRGLTAPRLGPSSLDGPSRSRNTFPLS